MNVRNLILGVIALVLVAGLSFAAGMRVDRLRNNMSYRLQPKFRQNIPQFPDGRGMGQGMMLNRGYGGNVIGQVTKVNGNQLTILLSNGNQVVVNLNTNTTYTKTSPANQASLQPGQNVVVSGQADANGSVSAESVRISSIQ